MNQKRPGQLLTEYEARPALPLDTNEYALVFRDGQCYRVYRRWDAKTWGTHAAHKAFDIPVKFLLDNLTGSRVSGRRGQNLNAPQYHRKELRYAWEKFGNDPDFRAIYTPVRCPMCGTLIDYGRGQNFHSLYNPKTGAPIPEDEKARPSFDRVVNTEFYTLSNTLGVCKRCNTTKQAMCVTDVNGNLVPERIEGMFPYYITMPLYLDAVERMRAFARRVYAK